MSCDMSAPNLFKINELSNGQKAQFFTGPNCLARFWNDLFHWNYLLKWARKASMNVLPIFTDSKKMWDPQDS